MREHRVRALLMGGQACVLYGAAQFSRDTDLAILADAANLRRLRAALADLDAVEIAVPPCELRFLRRGHAVHFRCRHPEAVRMRIDVMAKMRGVDAFAKLWKRRVSIEVPRGGTVDVLDLPDLVAAKKTQRDKDWPMIGRLVEANYFGNRGDATPARVRFWLREMRSAELLTEVASRFPRECRRAVKDRALLRHAMDGNGAALARELRDEEMQERERDRRHWLPLKAELEALRAKRRVR